MKGILFITLLILISCHQREKKLSPDELAQIKSDIIKENNLIPLTENGIPRAEIDLREYHGEHQWNAHFLTKNSFLDLL